MTLGILMLDTRFPRPAGDVGNPNSFDFPVIFETVSGASARRVVHDRASGLLDPFVEAGRRLAARGALGISTSCGFLALYQRELAQALPVPVAVSSLLQVAWLDRILPQGRRAGVITFDAASLTAAHLEAAGAPADTPVAGMPAGGALQRAILDDGAPFDRAAIARELADAGLRLKRAHPEVGAIVLECTNLPPYRRALAQATALPVYDVGTLLNWFWQGLAAGRPH